MPKPLHLADLKDLSVPDVRKHIISNYQGDGVSEDEIKALLKQYNVLIAYESVGSWGCDSSSFFFLQNKKTGRYAYASGSHCSCYGFEGQFKPEEMPKKYFRERVVGNDYWFSTGGYDDEADKNKAAVMQRVKELIR